jgi:hypothetical protein
MCTAAYREALIRDLFCAAASAPAADPDLAPDEEVTTDSLSLRSSLL